VLFRSGALGMNPEEQAWNEYARTVATQLSAAASPRTPTLLVEYYQHALGGANQTNEEFQRRVHNIVSEQTARQSAYSGKPYSQDYADSITSRLLSTPPAKDPNNFFPVGNEDTGIPNSGSQATGGMSPLPGMNKLNQIGTIKVIRLSDGKRGTINSSDFNDQKYSKV
jgi:hypothetical protein